MTDRATAPRALPALSFAAVAAFAFARMNADLGFVSWAIDACRGVLTPATLPSVGFLVLGYLKASS